MSRELETILKELKENLIIDGYTSSNYLMNLVNEAQFLTNSEKVTNTENKYNVECKGITIDVYDVLKAFNVTNPATQHAIKKLLKGGERGFKDINKDYSEAIDSIKRAIELNN